MCDFERAVGAAGMRGERICFLPSRYLRLGMGFAAGGGRLTVLGSAAVAALTAGLIAAGALGALLGGSAVGGLFLLGFASLLGAVYLPLCASVLRSWRGVLSARYVVAVWSGAPPRVLLHELAHAYMWRRRGRRRVDWGHTEASVDALAERWLRKISPRPSF